MTIISKMIVLATGVGGIKVGMYDEVTVVGDSHRADLSEIDDIRKEQEDILPQLGTGTYQLDIIDNQIVQMDQKFRELCSDHFLHSGQMIDVANEEVKKVVKEMAATMSLWKRWTGADHRIFSSYLTTFGFPSVAAWNVYWKGFPRKETRMSELVKNLAELTELLLSNPEFVAGPEFHSSKLKLELNELNEKYRQTKQDYACVVNSTAGFLAIANFMSQLPACYDDGMKKDLQQAFSHGLEIDFPVREHMQKLASLRKQLDHSWSTLQNEVVGMQNQSKTIAPKADSPLTSYSPLTMHSPLSMHSPQTDSPEMDSPEMDASSPKKQQSVSHKSKKISKPRSSPVVTRSRSKWNTEK